MFKFKKTMMSILAAVTALSVIGINAAAFGAATGTVKCGTYLNVRSVDSTSASIIGKLYNGAKVTITDGEYGWYKINYGSSTAWINGGYVAFATKQATVVENAICFKNVKYVFGGASPSGFDCSGYTMFLYNKVGIALPHSAASRATKGTAVGRSALIPGDLVFFATDGVTRNITHVGVYVGNNTVLQAQTGSVQKIAAISLMNSYWSSAYVSARRLL